MFDHVIKWMEVKLWNKLDLNVPRTSSVDGFCMFWVLLVLEQLEYDNASIFGWFQGNCKWWAFYEFSVFKKKIREIYENTQIYEMSKKCTSFKVSRPVSIILAFTALWVIKNKEITVFFENKWYSLNLMINMDKKEILCLNWQLMVFLSFSQIWASS